MTKPRRVLVVDDEPEQLEVCERFLSRHGFEVAVEAGGVEGLLRVRPWKPDLVILDICMPGIDGIAAADVLAKAPDTSSIPVILVTGKGKDFPDAVLRSVSRNLKVSAVLRKPLDLEALLRAVRQALAAKPDGADGDGESRFDVRRGPVAANLSTRQVMISGKQVPRLAAKRFELLVAFLQHDRPAQAEELLLKLWGEDHGIQAVQMTVARLRADLKDFPAVRIDTTPEGYVLTLVEE
ncbi:MAG: response regulator transcription factor [Elusimicrobia bacterium]|nr:response regulator transcription factor [Elusimicrobiota bacterium]